MIVFKVLGITLLVIIAILLVIIAFFFRTVNVPVSGVVFENIVLEQEENSVTIVGWVTQNGMVFRGYTYNIIDDSLFLTVTYSFVRPEWLENQSVRFNFTITDERINSVQTVYYKFKDDLIEIYPNPIFPYSPLF